MELDSNKTKVETQGQFSNKEINVRRHGNLVQLILTPSSSTKIRNALTLQASNLIDAYSLFLMFVRYFFLLLNIVFNDILGDARIQRGPIDIKKRR